MSAQPFDAGRDVADARSNLAVNRDSRTLRAPLTARSPAARRIAWLVDRGRGDDPAQPIRAASLDAVLDQMSAVRPIRSVTSEPYAYGSSHPLETIDIVFADGDTLALLYKKHNGPTATSAVAAPDFIRDSDRESSAFALIPGLRDDGAPVLYAIITDADESSLLFERISGVELYQLGHIEAWTAAAEWLAAFHVRHTSPLPAGSNRLLVRDRAYFEEWWRRANRFSRLKGRDPLQASRLQSLEPRWRRALERLDASPVTIVHGEFYPSNIMIEENGSGHRVRPVDWEMAGVAPGLLDLAALTGGEWDAQRREMVVNTYRTAYQNAAQAFGTHARLPHDFERVLDDCKLMLAVQWLGWSEDWTPPAEHRFDWLAEAEAIAGRPD